MCTRCFHSSSRIRGRYHQHTHTTTLKGRRRRCYHYPYKPSPLSKMTIEGPQAISPPPLSLKSSVITLTTMTTKNDEDYKEITKNGEYSNEITKNGEYLKEINLTTKKDDYKEIYSIAPNVPPKILDFIRECSLFKSAPESFLLAIASKLKQLTISPQEYISVEGQEAKAMYWLVKGTVGITSRDGESLYAELTPGAYFGEIGVLFDRPRTASVIARTKCLVLSLSAETLRLVLPDYPTIDKEIRDKAQERLKELKELKEGCKRRHERQKQQQQQLLRQTHDVLEQSQERAPLTDAELRDLIEAAPLLNTLPTSERYNLAENRIVDIQLFDRQGSIVSCGDPASGEVYFVASGVVELISGDDDANPSSSSSSSTPTNNSRFILPSGSMVGEGPFLGICSTHNYSVRALTPATMLVLTFDALNYLCRKYVDLQTQIEQLAISREPFTMKRGRRASAPLLPLALGDEPHNNNQAAIDCRGYGALIADDMCCHSPNNKRALEVAPLSPESLPSSPEEPQAKKLRTQEEELSEEDEGYDCGATKKDNSSNRRRPTLFKVGPLPDVILLKIFAHLDLPSLMSLRRTCTHWNHLLSTDSSLVTDLDLTPYNTLITDKNMQAIARFAGSRPIRVDISNCFHLTDYGFLGLVRSLEHARIRTLRMKSVWNVSSQAILELTNGTVGACLEELDLSNCRRVNDDTVMRLIGWTVPNSNAIIGCPRLKRLSLAYCKHVSDRSMYQLAMYASDRLEELDLTRCTAVTDQGFSYWSLRQFPNLRSVNLTDCTFLTDRSIIALAGAAKNLHSLNISFCCALSDVAVQVLSLGCPSLRRLNMGYCGSAVSDQSLNMVALHMFHLEELSVRGCIRVTRSGVDAILMACMGLKSFDISQCRSVCFA
ncbi:hypothetical protein TRVA0_021S01794 [Trichomonascus vanleenenianus]|uniref:uncharacterized protein n=1 Tax=Trichomonascus vanleenenianus TaxID=2268995 RepID=UPI003ECB3863